MSYICTVQYVATSYECCVNTCTLKCDSCDRETNFFELLIYLILNYNFIILSLNLNGLMKLVAIVSESIEDEIFLRQCYLPKLNPKSIYLKNKKLKETNSIKEIKLLKNLILFLWHTHTHRDTDTHTHTHTNTQWNIKKSNHQKCLKYITSEGL